MADNSNNKKGKPEKVKQPRAKSTKKNVTDEVTNEVIQEKIEETQDIKENIVEEIQEKIEEVKIGEEIQEIKEKIEEVKENIVEEIQEIKEKMEEVKEKIEEIQEKIVEEIQEIKEKIEEKIEENIIKIKSLINLLILITFKTDLQDKYDIKSNLEIIEIIRTIIKNNPTQISKIEECFINIMKDGKIDSSDIPYIMELLSTLYKSISDINLTTIKTSLSEISGQVIKLIFNIIVTEKFIEMDNGLDMITSFNALVDSSVMLISLSKYNTEISNLSSSNIGCICC
jgi:DNA repair exonuclease SbcCD ATPase subunit